MIGINDLPADDLWSIIFENLSIKDLFTCRLVNKKFKQFSDNTNLINKLIVGQPDYLEDCYWFYNDKPIEDEEMISLKCFRSIKSRSIFNLDKNLKYLKIYDQQLELKELSNLINLESLEFGRSCNYDQQIINSSNLKCIACRNSKLSIELNDKPKLEKIQFDYINEIKLNGNPESIKHLVTTDYVNELEIFKNLEIMELRYANQPVNENLLVIFKHLKQLKINLNFINVTDYSIEVIKNSLIKILNDKMKLKIELDIYSEGVKIESIDKLNELIEIKDSISKFRLNNYDLLDLNLPFIQKLGYIDLERCFNNIKTDLPLSFFHKFSNINIIHVDARVNDIVGFNWFLNNLKYLTTLTIYHEEPLDELSFNNLPTTIKELFIFNNFDINYDFILNLPKLISFVTIINKDLFDSAFKSFLNLKYLEDFKFNYKDKFISIKREDNHFILNRKIKKKLDYNQLVKKCNLIRSKRSIFNFFNL